MRRKKVRRSRRWIVLALLLAVGCGGNDHKNVYTATVEGTTVEVPALTPGRIIALPVQTGQPVAEGDTLAVIDTLELSYQRRQLLAGLKELTVQEEVARTTLTQAESNLAYLRTRHRRLQALVEKNSAPRQTLDDLTNQLQQAEAAVAKARQNLSAIEARREQLQARLNTVEKKIRDAVIVAPMAGIVAEKYFEVGEAVPPMSAIVQLLNLSRVEMKIYVSEKALPHIRIGQQVQVRVDGMDQTLTGTIRWISPKAEFTPKTILTPETRSTLVYAVKVGVENSQGILKHGMPVEVVMGE